MTASRRLVRLRKASRGRPRGPRAVATWPDRRPASPKGPESGARLTAVDVREGEIDRIVEAALPHPLLAAMPATLQPWLLPLEWDRDKLWSIRHPPVQVPLHDFRWLYELPFWRGNDGAWFDVTPSQFLVSPGDYPEHEHRVATADLEFPIHAIRRRGRSFILDGVHRLVRAHLEGHVSIAAVFLTADDLQHIATPADPTHST